MPTLQLLSPFPAVASFHSFWGHYCLCSCSLSPDGTVEESLDQKSKGCSLRSLQPREGAGEILLWPSSTQRGPKRKKGGDSVFSTTFCGGTRGNCFKLKEYRSRIGLRKKNSRMRILRQSKGTAAPCACALSGAHSASPTQTGQCAVCLGNRALEA